MFIHTVIAIRNPDDKYQKMMVAGRATMYLILWVKFRRRNKLPKNPHISEATLIQ
jgi:hypothetical protein